MANSGWNAIVDDYRTNYNAREDVVQANWEYFFTDSFVLGAYSKMAGEIHRPSIKIATTTVKPDIVIRDVKSDENLFVFELKQYNHKYDVEYEKQLHDYMRLLKLNVGVLVCQTIRVYVMLSDETLSSTEISFEKDSTDGIEFVELFKKGNFDENKVADFIKIREEKKQHIAEIKQKLQSLTLGDLLNEHFSPNYSDEEIRQATAGIDPTAIVSSISNAVGKLPVSQTGGVVTSPITSANEYTEPTFKYVIIKTSHERVAKVGSLYEATRYAWRASLARAQQHSYVFSVINGIVQEVYVVSLWQIDTHGRAPRIEFVGTPAPTSLSSQFVGKQIPACYRKPGMAAPILFSQN